MKADERLAEIRAWDTLDERHRILIDVVKYYPVDLENWTDDILLLASDLVRAQTRIDQLERLVPDADVLEEVAEYAFLEPKPRYTQLHAAALNAISKTLWELSAAIRKYREAECSPR